jgi:dihydroorotate dehydrogenase (fumarate)
MDTTTSYLGFRLPHPFMAGASPLGAHLDSVKRLEDAGCAAVVLHSLFEEQVTFANVGRIHQMDPLDARFSSELADHPAATEYPLSPDRYAEHIRLVKQAVKIPVIASLNGTSAESWLRFGHIIEQAGADALELNLYEVVTDLDTSTAAVEHKLFDVTTELNASSESPSPSRSRRSSRRSDTSPGNSIARAPMASCCSTASTSRTSTSGR